MKTEALKINLAQRILSIADNSILEKINTLLNQKNIVGFDAKGKPISEFEYISDLNLINDEIDKGNAELFSSDEVRKMIIDGNNLA